MSARFAALGLWVLLAGAPPTVAQTPPPREVPDLEGFSILPFDFGPPGARSLGMGGAFLAIADDATASEANPAGLVQLSRPEVSLHARNASYAIDVIDLNAANSLNALNNGRLGPRLRAGTQVGNSFADPIESSYDDDETNLSFASYVHPFDGFTASIYYRSSVRFRGITDFRSWDDTRLDGYDAIQDIDIALDTVGATLAFQPNDRWAFGFSLRASQLELRALEGTNALYLEDLEFAQLDAGASRSAVDSLGILDQRRSQQSYDTDASDITFNLGLLYNPGGRWTVGLAYKDGGSYSLRGFSATYACLGATTVPAGSEPCAVPDDQRSPSELQIKVPDFFGIGFSWRATDRLRLALDAHHITYSDLTTDIAANPNPNAGANSFVEPVDDVIELRLGVEYVLFLGRAQRPLTLRGGVIQEPDRDGFREIDSDETVGTVGIGTVLMDRLQLDLGARFGDSNSSTILSLVYRL